MVAELSGWNGHLLMGVEVTGLSLRSVQHLEHWSIFDIQCCSWGDVHVAGCSQLSWRYHCVGGSDIAQGLKSGLIHVDISVAHLSHVIPVAYCC